MHERDGEIVAGLRAGRPRAFDEAYARYAAGIHGFLRRMSGRADVADDLLQDTFLALARGAPGLREDTDLAAFLYTVARNAFRSHRRWSLLDVGRFLSADRHEAADPRIEERIAATEDARRLEQAIERLPDDQREVLLLVTGEGLSCERVGAILQIPGATVRKRLSRARAALDAALVEKHGFSRKPA